MNLVPLVEAVEVLTSPLEWGGEGAWLAECLRRVRDVRGVHAGTVSMDIVTELDASSASSGGWAGMAARGARPSGFEPSGARAAVHCRPSGRASSSWSPSGALSPPVSRRFVRLQLCRSTLGQAFDDVDTGMAIYRSDDRREVARNARWTAILERSRSATGWSSSSGAGCGRRPRAAGNVRVDEELELMGGGYRLVTSRAAAGTLLPEAAVLILVDRPGPGLPTTQELRITFGLRGREPQVALLAAEGLSNADIAERLRLSAHTVRHYLERVMTRLGLHTRKGLAVHLMAGSGERPQPLERKSS